jgi:hypothetical protein
MVTRNKIIERKGKEKVQESEKHPVAQGIMTGKWLPILFARVNDLVSASP